MNDHEQTEDGSADSEPWRGTALAWKLTPELIGAGMGAAGAVTLGPLAGPVVGAVAKVAADLCAERDQRAWNSVEIVLEDASAQAGRSVDGFDAWARATDQRLYLTTVTIQAALGTLNDQKMRALARVLAEALEDDAQLDASTLMVQTLAGLEAPHIRVLEAMRREKPPVVGGVDVVPGGWRLKVLKTRFPNLHGGLLPIMSALARHALVREGLAADDDDPAWQITGYGIACLEYLREHDSPSRG